MNVKAVEAAGLYKSFRLGREKRVPVIRGISLSVEPGEYCAVTGASGSGKTTLLNLLAGFESPDRGTIRVFGEEIGQEEEEYIEYRRENVGFIFQSFYLIPELTVLENVEFPLVLRGERKRNRRERAEALVEALGLQDVGNHTPNRISGGQNQRAAIARALITRPRLILADEPTGNLDSVTSGEVIELLERIVVEEKKTLIMVTHDEALAQRADRILRVVDGRIESTRDYNAF